MTQRADLKENDMIRLSRSTTRAAAVGAGLVLAAGTTLAGASAAIAAPVQGGAKLSTTLQPAQEVAPFTGVAGASGSAALRLNAGLGRVCINATISGFAPALAHIHEAARGANGAVVVDFTSLIKGNTVVGCVKVDRAQVKEIQKDPADYYVNVHVGLPPAASFFQGIRGQLG